MWDGHLRAPTLPADFTPQTVLDVGCGSGAWAVSYAQAFPNSEVVATDISPPAIKDKPSNLTISSSADAQKESDWPKGRTFDYIHLRLLTLAIRDWSSVISLCWKHLNSGGWLEIDDARFPYAAENEQANIENSLFLRSSYLQMQAQKMNQLDITASAHHIDRLKLQGFSNISQTIEKWPVNGEWPQDEKYKQIGAMTGRNWEQMFGRYGPLILTSKLQMSTEKAAAFVKDMLEECKNDRDMHYYFPMYVYPYRSSHEKLY